MEQNLSDLDQISKAQQILNIQVSLSILFWFCFHGNLCLLGNFVCVH